MPIIYLVRHGRIADQPADSHNPELGAAGQAQAQAVAQALQERLPGPLPILSSPLRRCRETAAPLAGIWQAQPAIEPRVIEVPSPQAPGVRREAWLEQALHWSWPQAEQHGSTLQPGYDQMLRAWRRGVVEAVLACRSDTVIFSHFVPINVLAGAALGLDRITCFRPDNASVTVFETSGETIRLLERGREKTTQVK
jgi:broad specificity phosphatase PhoE